jgi:hypothetical protein
MELEAGMEVGGEEGAERRIEEGKEDCDVLGREGTIAREVEK